MPNRTYDVCRTPRRVDYDDSAGEVLAPGGHAAPAAHGRVCFNWYRIAVTIPERVGDLDPTGATVVFEVVIDDYAEVWVDGGLPQALGDSGGPVVAGFNAPNRVVLTATPGPVRRFQIAVFGINGPISASPHNYIWLRTATLDFYAAERRGRVADAALDVERADAGARRRRCPPTPRSSGSPAASSSPRARCGPGRRAAVQLAEHQRDLPLDAARAASPCSAPRAATPAPTSAATTSPAPTG